MFKKTADLLGNTDLPIVGTPKIFGNIAVNSDQEFPNLRNNGSCEFRVEFKKSTSPYNVVTESFTFDSNTVYTLSAIVAHLNTLTSNLVFDSDEGCISVESVYSGHKAYIKILTKTTVSAFDPLPLMGLFADPHPSSFSQARDVDSSPVRPATQGNKHGTTFIARKEDRLSSGVNRALAGVALNSEHTQLQLTKPVAVGIQIEVDATIHASRLHLNSVTNTYEYIYLGPNGNDSIDQALDGRRVFVGGLNNASNIREIEGAFLIKSTENRSLLSDSLDYIRVGAVVSNSTVQPGTTTISSPSFDSTGAVVSGTGLADSTSLYSDYGNVLGEDIPVHSSVAVSSFTTSTIKTSTSISSAEVGFKVVVSNSNPADYTNDGTYRITKVISDTEIEVEPVSSDEPKILNDQPNGSYTPTITISTGGEFIHHAILLFGPDLVFPSNGKILISLYVESSIEEYGASFQQETLQARSLIVADYGVSLGTSFDGLNPDLESGYHISQQKRGVEIASTLAQTHGMIDTADGPHTGEISGDWVLTAASGQFFYEDSLGSLFKVDNKWARAVKLIDFKTLQLSPIRKIESISANTSATYYKYSEQNGSVQLPSAVSAYNTAAPGYVFIGESDSSSSTRQKGFLHLTEITATADNTSLIGKTATTTFNSDLVTLDFNPIESGVIHPKLPTTSSDPAPLPTVVCISSGSTPGWYLVNSMTSTQIELTGIARNTGTVLALASETVNIHFFCQTLASQQFISHNGRSAFPALTVHGETGRDHQLNSPLNYGLAVSWNSEGGGILSSVNRNGLQGNEDGSEGYLFEGYLAPPADGIYLNIEGVSSATSSDLAGSYGLEIISSSEAYNINNISTYRSASQIPPKSSIRAHNSGGDSGLLLTRGAASPEFWDSPVAEIRQHSSIYGAGGALSVKGSWYSRYSAQVYLNGEDSVLSSNTIIPQSVSGEVPRIGSSKIIFTSSASMSRVDSDYSLFAVPHDSVFSCAGGNSSPHEMAGQQLKVSYTSGNSFTGIVIAVKLVGSTLNIATDITSSDVFNNGNISKVEVLGSRFRLNADIESYMLVGRSVGITESRLAAISRSGTSANSSAVTPYLDLDDLFPYENFAVGLGYSPQFYTIDSFSGLNNNSSYNPTAADNLTAQDWTGDRETEFDTSSFMDLYPTYYSSTFESGTKTPGGHAQFSFGDTILYPRTSYSNTDLTDNNGTNSHGNPIEGACSIVNKGLLNSPINDSFFIRFPTVYNTSTVPNRTDGPASLDTRFVEWFKAMQITPLVTDNVHELVYEFCRLGPANFNSNNYSIQFKAVVGIQQYSADATNKIEVTPVLLVIDQENEAITTVHEGTTVQLTSLFQTVQETLSKSILEEQSTRTFTPITTPEGSLVLALKVRHYYSTNPTGSADTTMNRFYVRSIEFVENSYPIRVPNLEAYGNIIAPNFQLSVWKSGGQTISPAHVDLFTEETPMPFATHPTDADADYPFRYGRIGANGVGAIKDSSGQWIRPTYSREYFFSKGTHAATINLYHPFHDPLWYAMTGQRIFEWQEDPTATAALFSDIDSLTQWQPDITDGGMAKAIMPGPTGFTIPLNPPNGAILTSMDWNLFMQPSQGNQTNDADEECYGAFWADKPSATTSGSVNLNTSFADYTGSTEYNVNRWNRVAGVRISLYRYNCMGTNQTDHYQDGFSTSLSSFRAGAELLWTTISSCLSDPHQLNDSSGRHLVTGRPLRGSAKFYTTGVEDNHPDIHDVIGDSGGGLGPDMLREGNNERFLVDTNNYSYFATITFYGGSRMSLGSNSFSYVNRMLNGTDMAAFFTANSFGDSSGNAYSPMQFPYSVMRAGLLDRSSGIGDYYGALINMGFSGFRITGPSYLGTGSHVPHFTPKVHFRGFKLNWKTNKI